jgi:pantoate--beta-alanine ligase
VEVVRSIALLRARLAPWKTAGEPVGLVPTMGALHAGHMALVGAAQRQCRYTVVSIFVNPKQFGPNEDLAAYPRREAADLDMLRQADVDLAFLPPATEIYPAGFATLVRVAGLGDGLCGARRPGHFDGVTTVVAKLLLQALPEAAYFGEKDYQQLVIVRRLVGDLDIPVRIEGVATVREADGLALSSRNQYLSPTERRVAPTLAGALRDIAAALAATPAAVEREIARGRTALTDAGFAVDYLEIREAASLMPVAGAITAPTRVFAAAYLGRTRLIDNMPIAPSISR